MIDEGIASLSSHPLGAILLSVITAAITAALVVKLLIRRPPAAADARSATATNVRPSVPMDDDRAVVAAIVGAVVATMGAYRIVRIDSANAGSLWTTEVRSRHHAAHTPNRSPN
jgi:hypothetical protein